MLTLMPLPTFSFSLELPQGLKIFVSRLYVLKFIFSVLRQRILEKAVLRYNPHETLESMF